MTMYFERLDVIDIGLYNIPCSSSRSTPFILSFLNVVIHIELSELHLNRTMKENNDDHIRPCITMYFERHYAIFIGLYKFPYSSSGFLPFIFSFLNFAFILRSEFHLR